MSRRKGKRHVRRLIERLRKDEGFALALRARLQDNVLECPVTGCWEWQRRRDPAGYGMLAVRVNGGSPVPFRAHVLAWILFQGKFSGRLVRAHRCDNPPCCNPDHIEQKEQAQNYDDSMTRGTHKNARYFASLGDRAKLPDNAHFYNDVCMLAGCALCRERFLNEDMATLPDAARRAPGPDVPF